MSGPVGVVVVKVEFDDMEASWSHAATSTFVANKAGQVLLTSTPSMRFRQIPEPAGSQGRALVVNEARPRERTGGGGGGGGGGRGRGGGGGRDRGGSGRRDW